MNPFVTAVTPLADYQLLLSFANGEQRIFDVRPYTSRGVFVRLLDPRIFNAAQVVAGSVEWTGEIDLSYDTMYLGGLPTIADRKTA